VSYMVSSPPGRFILGNTAKAALPMPPDAAALMPGSPYLYDGVVDGKPARIASMELDYGDVDAPQRFRVQVSKSLAVRERVGRELIFTLLVPLLMLGVLLSLLVRAGVVRGLIPLERLERALGGKRVETLAPIEIREAPTEVHALVKAVNQLLETVRRHVSQEKRFLNDAAHQLRTPLAGVRSQLDLAMTETSDSARTERLNKVHMAVDRSTHLVQQLLSLARSETDVAAAPLDAAQLGREVAREWAPQLLARGIDFGFDSDGQRLPVLANALLLKEALGNVLDNAARYASPPDGEPAQITLRAHGDGDRVVLSVSDNGPGLSPDEQATAFERFTRFSTLPGGVGLGLAIVKEIAQRLGGEACIAQQSPHTGLTIQIRLQRN
jgi:two-component system, OmpR family, sensor histidine kinase TctE